jgi:hypothetical protein
MPQNNTTAIQNRASSILDAIDALLVTVSKENSTSTQGQTESRISSKDAIKAEASNVTQPNNIFRTDLMNLKNELGVIKKALTTLTVEVSTSQQTLKSLTGLGKQVASLQATVNKLISQSVASQNPCDTPEGLAGEIKGC